MKKEGGMFVIFGLFAFSILLATFVSAQYGSSSWGNTEGAIESVKNALTPVLSIIFGGSAEYLFEKLLFFFILLVLIFAILSRFPIFEDRTAIIWIVTLAVSFLATRFMTDTGWFLAIFLPYHVLGIALLSFIPFFIFFYFVEKGIESGFLRKIAWFLYTVVFIGIWWQRYPEIGRPAWIFLATAMLSLIMALADNYIQGIFVRSAIRQGLGTDRVKEIVRLQKEINDDMRLLESAHGDQRRRILKDLAEKEKTVKALSKRPY